MRQETNAIKIIAHVLLNMNLDHQREDETHKTGIV
jgi:hypothetical protein